MSVRNLSRRSALAFAAAASLGLLAACDGNAVAATPSAPRHSLTPAQAYDALQTQATGFSVGPQVAAHVAYVFFDPQCPHCAHLWQAAEPLAGNARIVWVPVALLGRASMPQGATILGASDPSAKMRENEASILSRNGGISMDRDSVSRLKDKVEANTALFNSFRADNDGVPFVITKVNGEVRTQGGAMPTEALKRFLGI